MTIEPLPPCGECGGCKLAETIRLHLAEVVDPCFAPRIIEARREYYAYVDSHRARSYQDDRQYRRAFDVLGQLLRRVQRIEADWHLSRERFLTPNIAFAMSCERVGYVISDAR